MAYSRTPFYIYPTDIGGRLHIEFADVAASVPWAQMAVFVYRAEQRGELPELIKMGKRLYEADSEEEISDLSAESPESGI